MLAPKSTHKHKRSSARSDKARKLGPSRWIVNVLPADYATHGETSQAAGPSTQKRLNQFVDAHPFNRSLEVILPLFTDDDDPAPESSTELPDAVRTLLSRLEGIASSHRSYRARIPLTLLLDPIFVTAYLKTGSLIALTDPSGVAGLSPDLEDTVCIDGQGTLVLSLCKDTYQTLGLTGRASHFSRLASGRAADRTSGPDSRFIVELPLLSPSFVPGKKGYQQALDRLRAWDRSRAQALAAEQTLAQTHASSSMGKAGPVSSDDATWDMLFVWSPSRGAAETIAASSPSASGSTLVNEIRFPEDFVRAEDVKCKELPPVAPVVTDSVWVPSLHDPCKHALASSWREQERHFSELEESSSALPTWSAFQDALQEAVEWAGLASLSAAPLRTFTRPDATCVYSPPSPSQPGRIVKLSWSGSATQPLLLSPLLISQIADEVDRFVLKQGSAKHTTETVPWATLSCSGFPHAPLTWRSRVPFSSRYGAKELPGTKAAAPPKARSDEEARMTDASSSEDEDDAEDSDSSIDMGEQPSNRKTKKRSKRTLGKNQTEHSFTPSTGETGWISFALGPHKSTTDDQRGTPRSSRWVFAELVGTDTRS